MCVCVCFIFFFNSEIKNVNRSVISMLIFFVVFEFFLYLLRFKAAMAWRVPIYVNVLHIKGSSGTYSSFKVLGARLYVPGLIRKPRII